MSKLSWKPVRRGRIYCAPACGGGCTWAAFKAAHLAAAKLRKGLPGFKPRVWENLGWHWDVTSGPIEIHHFGGRRPFGASYDGEPWAHGKTARSALRKLVKALRQRASDWEGAASLAGSLLAKAENVR